MPSRLGPLALLLVACGAAPVPCDTEGPASPCHAPDPGAPGPYAVGVTTVTLTDDSREEPEGGPRILKVEVWYPAVEASRDAPRDAYRMEAEAPADLVGQLTGTDLGFAHDAARDADPERAGAPYPLLTFSHGKMVVPRGPGAPYS